MYVFFSPCLVVTVDLVVDADTRLVSVVGFDSQQSAVVLPCSAGNQAAGVGEDSTVCSLVCFLLSLADSLLVSSPFK